MQVQRIDYKIARRIIQLSGSHLLYATIALCLVTAFLSMWISNTATAAMILPLALGLLSNIDRNDHHTRVFMLLAIAYSASIGGIGTLVGSPPNAIAAKALNMHFVDWMPYGIPIMLAMLPLMFVVLMLVFRPNLNQRVNLANDERLPWTRPRIITLIVFITTATLWILGAQLKKLGISSPDTFVAIAAIVAVVTLGLASWKDVVNNTDWGVLLLFGGGITLSVILRDSGASLVLGQQIAQTFGNMHPLLIILIIAAFIIFLTEFTSNTASAALLVPVFATIGVELGMPQETLVLVIGIGASCAFMLPVATPPNAIVFGTGEIRQRDMIRGGVVLNIASVALVALFAYFFIH
nr:DASS family sodium-coupled anion symporter [Suttonella sp. R2A3]